MAEGGHVEPEKKSDERIEYFLKQLKEAVDEKIYRLLEQALRAKDLQLENAKKRLGDEIKGFRNLTEEQKRKIEELEKEDKEKNEKIERLENENKELFHRVQCILQCLEHEGKICANNCTVCAIIWICKEKLGLSLCGPQLMAVMVYHVAANIKIGNLMCANMIDVIMKCGVIDSVMPYIFPEDIHEKTNMANEIWKQLQNMGERVCIIGTKDVRGIGHGVVSYLEKDGTVKIYDPQHNCAKTFPDYIDDDDTEGLRLHFVNTKNLEGIIEKYRECLYHTNEPNEKFLERLCALSDLR